MERETYNRRKTGYLALVLVAFLSLAGIADGAISVRQVAWVTAFYPRTALRHAMCLVEDGTVVEEEDEIPVKIKWKCLELFRDAGRQKKG